MLSHQISLHHCSILGSTDRPPGQVNYVPIRRDIDALIAEDVAQRINYMTIVDTDEDIKVTGTNTPSPLVVIE